jgi:hypothetical protein
MEYKEVFGSPNKVNANVARLTTEGWEPTGLTAAGYFLGQMSATMKIQGRRPTYLSVMLRRAVQQ